MPITEGDILACTAPRGKSRELHDGNGLILRVYGSGKKVWVYKAMHNGTRTYTELGIYPTLSIETARHITTAIITASKNNNAVVVTQEIHTTENCEVIRKTQENDSPTFEAVTKDWYSVFTSSYPYSEKHLQTIRYRLTHYVNPVIGNIPITKLQRSQLARLVKNIVKTGHYETAKRVCGIIQQVFYFAFDSGYIDVNIGQGITKALPRRKIKQEHFAHCENSEQVGNLMRALHKIKSPRTRTALLLSAYCFPRCGEMLASTWSEFDFEKCVWTIPAEHTKARRALCIPLAPQIVDVLQWYRRTKSRGALRGVCKLFDQTEASLLNKLKDITSASHGTIPRVTIHGFRHTASTVLYSLGYNTQWIEHELAHKDKNSIRGVYNSYDFLAERRGMMNDYATWLDTQATQAKNQKEQCD